MFPHTRHTHPLEPCIEEEESVCPEPSVIEGEDNSIQGVDLKPDQQESPDNFSGLLSRQPSNAHVLGTEIEVPEENAGNEPEVPETGHSGDNIENAWNSKASVMLHSHNSSHTRPEFVENYPEHSQECDVEDRIREVDRKECDGDPEDLTQVAFEEIPLKPTVELGDTLQTKSKLLSPILSHNSKESGIQIDQEEPNEEQVSGDFLEGELTFQSGIEDKDKQLPKDPEVKAFPHECKEDEERVKFTHWIVDFDDVTVADFLTSGEQNIIGECITSILRDFQSRVKKPRFEFKSGPKVPTCLKGKMAKKPNKTCKEKVKGPYVEISNQQACSEEMSKKKFPNRKSNPAAHRTFHQEPVKCGCRDTKENMNDLFIQGTSVPLYKFVNEAVEEFKLQYL